MTQTEPADRTRTMKTIEQRLAEADPGVTEALEEFGTLMLEELREHTYGLESKAMSTLGWSAALLVFLLFPFGEGASGPLATLPRVVRLTAATAATVAIVFAYLALRLTKWAWPSEHDWFREDLLSDPSALRRHHVQSMLATYRDNRRRNQQKIRRAKIAELCLVIAAILVGAAVFISTLARS
jgi:hypothetical protein